MYVVTVYSHVSGHVTVLSPTGVPVYIHDELYQKMMTVSNTAASLAQDVVACYTQHS